MQKNYCDLCKKEIKKGAYQSISFYKNTSDSPFKDFDLCNECYEKIIKFTKQLKK